MKIRTFLLSIFLLSCSSLISSADLAAGGNSIVSNEGEEPSQPTTEEDAEGDAAQTSPNTQTSEPQRRRIEALIAGMKLNQSHEINVLDSESGSFLVLHRESETGDPQGCIILLHGDNEHPDWPQVISPIRKLLNENSWCTLSVEVPDIQQRDGLSNSAIPDVDDEKTLPNEALVFERIDRTIEFMRATGYGRAAYLGHGTGAAYALKYVVRRGLGQTALIMIDTATPAPISNFDMAQFVESIRMPSLDYYFDTSAEKVRFARERQSAANKRSSKDDLYVQIKAMPDRRFDPASDQRLAQRIRGFLKQNTEQKKQRRPLPSIDKGLFHSPPQ